MGDLIEITTTPGDKLDYYKISNAMKFYLKGKGSAAIGLAFDLNENYSIWIVIGNQYSWIDPQYRVRTVNMIPKHTYKLFWISWYGQEIRIGEGDNPKPFLVGRELIRNNIYISFSSSGQSTMHWKFRVPPTIKQHKYKKISSGELKWVKMESNCLPEGALIGGYEDEVLYIMRGMHEGALTPGKYVPSEGAGYVAWGSIAHKKTFLEILCGYDGVWFKTHNDKIPEGAVEGGYSEVNHETLYVGRSKYDGVLVPGKVQRSHNVCYMPYKALTVFSSFYEILVVPCKTDSPK